MGPDIPGLRVIPELCKGCLACQLGCSIFKEGQFNPSKARIRISLEPKAIEFTDDCDGCLLCVQYCVFGALQWVGSPRGER